ncbi:MAG: rhamnogalacturonan acetylesterase [Draconibacterium sp.]
MIRIFITILLAVILVSCKQPKDEPTGKPTLFIIGDSTVKNGRGDGANGLWGWGDPIQCYFDTARINIENHALGGTSSRTFRSKGLWDKVLGKIQPGDFVLMQFGHNDNGPVNDTIRARGTIKGVGDETEEIDNLLTGEHEIVHSYGWYLNRFVLEAREKGAITVIISPIPRNDWKGGKVIQNDENYGKWAKEIAQKEQTGFIDLNHKMTEVMDTLGEVRVTNRLFFDWDHTHTSAKGALLAASKVAEGLTELKSCKLKSYLLNNPEINFPKKKRVFIIGDSTVANGKDDIIGWGRELPFYFDTSRVEIINKARGGRSSRSYRYEGLWNEVLTQLNKGDFLLIQFGHNDGGNIDKPKYRGSLPGMGDETQEVLRENDSMEVVHTYGWYMKKYISEAKEKGVTVFVLSMIPRNIWKGEKVERVDDSYGGWAQKAATAENAYFVDLNTLIANEYENLGQKKVRSFFTRDHTHTNTDGAKFNAAILAREIKAIRDCPLYGYVSLR